jgi:cytochrome d ubiquinol oxidase subunit II
MEFLQLAWFFLVGILILGYALLDGFDLGVGNLHLFNKSAKEREEMIYSIGPFWDSNQVWLLTGGGALFAAFPMVYATVFSGFYLAFMLLLLAIIFRGVSIEFHHQLNNTRWKKSFDWGFGLSSIVASILFGVAIGNILRGIPMDAQFNYTGSFFDLLNPYSLVMGLLSLSMFTMHGAAFLYGTGTPYLAQKAEHWAKRAWILYFSIFIVGTVWSYLAIPRLFTNFFSYPILFIAPIITIGALLYFPKAFTTGSNSAPFFTSALSLVGIVAIIGGALFPYLVPAKPDLLGSLTIYNSSSSQLTLTVMLILAGIGMPLVIFYNYHIYKKFLRHPQNQAINQSLTPPTGN